MPKRPHDMKQSGMLMTDIATCQSEDGPSEPTRRTIGIHSQAEDMNAEKRREIVAKSNAARSGSSSKSESTEIQLALDVRPEQAIRVPFERIFKEATGAAEKGHWFEHLFMAVARDVPDFQIEYIWPWRRRSASRRRPCTRSSSATGSRRTRCGSSRCRPIRSSRRRPAKSSSCT